ncbi:hypothetical protein [Marinobacter piscensis]|uniref:hypothetical protein n=1 Tax=Marinobacter piscensis TaxID=1562308 RepID=UPI00119DDA7F|nr:hypothetical protein [Marinobacter piscensis]
MLKQLWRKLGAEFPQTGLVGREGKPGASDTFKADSFRVLPHVTHTGEFHLERLTGLLNSRYGKRYEITETSSDEELLDLIVYAARVQDQDVQRELLLFYLNCSPVIQDYLRSEEALLNQL